MRNFLFYFHTWKRPYFMPELNWDVSLNVRILFFVLENVVKNWLVFSRKLCVTVHKGNVFEAQRTAYDSAARRYRPPHLITEFNDGCPSAGLSFRPRTPHIIPVYVHATYTYEQFRLLYTLIFHPYQSIVFYTKFFLRMHRDNVEQ